MRTALLCIDLTNEFISPDGKLASEGYAEFAVKHDSLNRIARIQEHFREQDRLVIHMRTVYSENYHEHYKYSPLLGGLRKKNALILGQYGTEFVTKVAPKDQEPIINKHRVNAFHRTRLDLILRTQDIQTLYIIGVGTDTTIDATVWDAHDRDYDVHVISDACIAANDYDNAVGLKSMEKVAKVQSWAETAVKLATTTDDEE